MGIPIQMIGNVGTLLGRNKGPSMGGNPERLFWAIIHTRSITFTKQYRSCLSIFHTKSIPPTK